MHLISKLYDQKWIKWETFTENFDKKLYMAFIQLLTKKINQT